jgi:Tfp pilus assembly protein PilO
MTRTTKILVAVALTAAAGAAYWFLLLAPKQDEIAALDVQIATKQVELEQSRQLMATYEQAKDSYKANYATLARLGKAVTADDDVRSLLVQIDATADRSGVEFGKIEVGGTVSGTDSGSDASAPAEGELAPPPGTVPFGDGGFSAMPFSFSFTGSYFELSTFLARLERFVRVQNENIGVNGRLLRLESVQLAPVDSETSSELRAEIAAATYIVPPADDLPGVPASPDGAAPATTESAITPPDVPTATATGATP